MIKALECHHCNTTVRVDIYVPHVKACVAEKISEWDQAEYSKRYFAQVRAISRFPQPGRAKRQSMYRAWGWWVKLRDGGPGVVPNDGGRF